MLTADQIKEAARRLGADLVGIASADELNANPPDPQWPQTPGRLWPECRSVIALAQRIPWGMFRSPDPVVNRTVTNSVMSRLDQVALGLAYFIESHGYHAFHSPIEYTDTALKSGSYGSLSLRHVAIEAGLGTLGLNMLLITPEYGPRVYVSAVLTDLELRPDGRIMEQLCLGPACGRCLMVCPSDAVRHWGLDKRQCSTCAQPSGVSAVLRHVSNLVGIEDKEELKKAVWGPQSVDAIQSFWKGVGAYGSCPKCLEHCPVGEDYKRHLRDVYGKLPEVSAEKKQRLQLMRQAELSPQEVPSANISRRWIGQDAPKAMED